MGLWVVPWRFLGMCSLQRMVLALQHPSRYSFLTAASTVFWPASVAVCIEYVLMYRAQDFTRIVFSIFLDSVPETQAVNTTSAIQIWTMFIACHVPAWLLKTIPTDCG